MKYVFSGHESFACKSLWLKKGYDFINDNSHFGDPDSVVQLGVGKNMVASIRYWMRAFDIIRDDKLTGIADYIMDTETGKDPFLEDLGTLWLLHYLIVSHKEATIYHLLFIRLQRERKDFDRTQAINFVKRIMAEDNKMSQYNENTVRKDIGTLLLNYVRPTKPKTFEDYSNLLTDLDLIRTDADGKNYMFNIEGKRPVPWQIFLYAVINRKEDDNTVDYDVLQEIGLVFCMNDMEVITMCKNIVSHNTGSIVYSDVAGIRQLQFLTNITATEALDRYYA